MGRSFGSIEGLQSPASLHSVIHSLQLVCPSKGSTTSRVSTTNWGPNAPAYKPLRDLSYPNHDKLCPHFVSKLCPPVSLPQSILISMNPGSCTPQTLTVLFLLSPLMLSSFATFLSPFPAKPATLLLCSSTVCTLFPDSYNVCALPSSLHLGPLPLLLSFSSASFLFMMASITHSLSFEPS